jgi:acetate kinase
VPQTVFVVNSGSSSIKYQLLDVATGSCLASGIAERIGETLGAVSHKVDGAEFSRELPIADHTAGLRDVIALFDAHGPDLAAAGVVGVGHRVVQGGDRFDGPVLVTPQVIADITELAALAPLHNPPALQGIAAAQDIFPDLPHVAVFDTAFHRTLPPAAYTYAIPWELAQAHAIRRYGAHGTSHKYVSRKVAELMGRDPAQLNVIVIHAGSGASVCAVAGGRSVETSMGLTPLEGLVMGTRSGDMDLAVLFHLHRQAGMSFEELDTMCNKQSGLLGLTGSNDMRDVHARAAAGEERAQVAIATFTHRIRSYIGAYYAQLGRVDAVVFTAGVGENDPVTREQSVAGLSRLGIVVDPEVNAAVRGGRNARISPADGAVEVWVVGTNEELEIARETQEVIQTSS